MINIEYPFYSIFINIKFLTVHSYSYFLVLLYNVFLDKLTAFTHSPPDSAQLAIPQNKPGRSDTLSQPSNSFSNLVSPDPTHNILVLCFFASICSFADSHDQIPSVSWPMRSR